MSEDIREEIETALRKRAEWPSMHWPSLDALQHADVTLALADALMPLAARIQAQALREAADAHMDQFGERVAYDIVLSTPTSRWLRARAMYDIDPPARADRLEQGDPS